MDEVKPLVWLIMDRRTETAYVQAGKHKLLGGVHVHPDTVGGACETKDEALAKLLAIRDFTGKDDGSFAVQCEAEMGWCDVMDSIMPEDLPSPTERLAAVGDER